MKQKEKLMVLVGPTASGKTDVSIKLAQHFNAEIVSADSVQIYEKLDIGSAKPSEEQLELVPHHMIGVVPLEQAYSVAQYQEDATNVIQNIIQAHKKPFVVGGTGFYVQSLITTMNFSQTAHDENFRVMWQEKEDINKHCAHRELMKIDPVTAERLHPNDTKRVIRALEVFHLSGVPLSEKKDDMLESPYDICMVGITMPREKLIERINLRVDIMIEQGLQQEVVKLLEEGYNPDLVALQGIGYKEMICALRGEYSIDDAIALIKQSTRQLAKRQMTWFRRDKRIKWFDAAEYQTQDDLYNDIERHYNKAQKEEI